MDSKDLGSCVRCGRPLRTMRAIIRHGSRPCDQDNVMVRRERAKADRESGVPMRPVRRGRKLMMKVKV